jgi:hypothetical protein
MDPEIKEATARLATPDTGSREYVRSPTERCLSCRSPDRASSPEQAGRRRLVVVCAGSTPAAASSRAASHPTIEPPERRHPARPLVAIPAVQAPVLVLELQAPAADGDVHALGEELEQRTRFGRERGRRFPSAAGRRRLVHRLSVAVWSPAVHCFENRQQRQCAYSVRNRHKPASTDSAFRAAVREKVPFRSTFTQRRETDGNTPKALERPSKLVCGFDSRRPLSRGPRKTGVHYPRCCRGGAIPAAVLPSISSAALEHFLSVADHSLRVT